jgi:hypothetical protein
VTNSSAYPSHRLLMCPAGVWNERSIALRAGQYEDQVGGLSSGHASTKGSFLGQSVDGANTVPLPDSS